MKNCWMPLINNYHLKKVITRQEIFDSVKIPLQKKITIQEAIQFAALCINIVERIINYDGILCYLKPTVTVVRDKQTK